MMKNCFLLQLGSTRLSTMDANSIKTFLQERISMQTTYM